MYSVFKGLMAGVLMYWVGGHRYFEWSPLASSFMEIGCIEHSVHVATCLQLPALTHTATYPPTV